MIVIVNPRAGRSGGRRFRRVVMRLRELAGEVVIWQTRAPGHATALAQQAAAMGVDRVAVAGGDGTINEVVNGLAGSAVPMAVLPLGTANVTAVELGLRGGIDAVVDHAVNGEAATVHLGKAGGRFFLLMLGVGFDAAVVHAVRPGVKRHLGRAAYVLAGLRILARGWESRYRVAGDGWDSEVAGLVAANARRYAGGFVLAPEAGLTRPGLDVFLFRKGSRVALVRYAAGIILGRLARVPGVELRRGVRRLQVDGGPKRTVQLDGDAAGGLPLDIGFVPDSLRLVMPRPPERAMAGSLNSGSNGVTRRAPDGSGCRGFVPE